MGKKFIAQEEENVVVISTFLGSIISKKNNQNTLMLNKIGIKLHV